MALPGVIFVNNNEPARVHVFGDGEAKVHLLAIGGGPELTDAQINAAFERGRVAGSHEPHAASACYDGAWAG